MKIGIEYTSAVTQGAGIGRLTRGLVHAVERLDRRNDYQLVVARHERNATIGPLATNFEVREIPFRERALAIMWHRLGLPISVERFTGPLDLFHATNFVLPPLRGARGIVTIHDLSYLLYPDAAAKTLVTYLNKVVPRSVARAEMIIADSESTRRDIVEHLGIPDDRVRVVYGGVDERFHRDDDAHRRSEVALRYGIDLPAILAVGTLQPRKNLARLIDAYVLLREQGLSHTLYIAGASGWLYSDIFRTIEDLGLQPFVKFLGYVRDEDLPTLYSLADVFVYPSLYEGFGLPILEAMGCGTPVVCSDVSSIPEVAGEAAAYCDPLDVNSIAGAIDRVLRDRQMRTTIIEKGNDQVKRFSWPAAGRALLDVYQLVGGR